MPELPEVETVRRGLAPIFESRTLIRVEQRRPDLRFPLPPRFAERLTGRRVIGLDRRAKFLLMAMEDETVLLMHLGMSGRFTILPPASAASAISEQPGRFHRSFAATTGSGTHDHIVFHVEDGTRVVYSDPRRFGYMDLIPSAELATSAHLAALGPEPVGNAFSSQLLANRLAGKKSPIKSALLDQKVVAGLGNIYVCEALFRAGISPRRKASSVAGPVRAARLAEAIRSVLSEAIAAGGSSLRDYAAANGELGYFQHTFRVYDREGATCPTPTCGATIERIVQANRSTFFCPRCQK